MRIKKKGLALWLALFLGVSSLSGCGGGDDGMTQLSEKGAEILNSTEEDSDTDVEPLKQKTKLPEDGIITQAQMETIAGKDEKYYMHIPSHLPPPVVAHDNNVWFNLSRCTDRLLPLPSCIGQN